MQKRNLVFVAVMLLITLGLYGIYWLVRTRREMVDKGAQIPTTFLILIPFANIYYLYRWSMAAVKTVNKTDVFGWMLLLLHLIFTPAAVLIAQDSFNNLKQAATKKKVVRKR